MAEKKSPQNKSLSQIEERRAALKKELAELENELEDSIDDIKEGVTTKLDPKYWIRNYPLESFGVSTIIGFIAGNIIQNKGGSSSSERILQDSLLWSELKRALTRKTVQKIIDIIDSKVDKDQG